MFLGCPGNAPGAFRVHARTAPEGQKTFWVCFELRSLNKALPGRFRSTFPSASHRQEKFPDGFGNVLKMFSAFAACLEASPGNVFGHCFEVVGFAQHSGRAPRC
jgi:hypothetical protein